MTTSSSDSNESTDQLNLDDENEEEVEDDFETEPPVFDYSKENEYKIKYKQSFEEVVSLNNVYILNLDAQKV